MNQENIRDMIVRDVSLPSLFSYIEAQLPDTMPELKEVVAFTDTELKAWQAAAENLKSINAADEAIEEAVRNGQKWGVARIAGESKKGKLAYDEPPERYRGIPAKQRRLQVAPAKHEKLNMKRGEMQSAQQIASHPEAVERVIEKAVEENEIPRKVDVLNEIRRDREKERKAQAPPKSTIDLVGDELIYKNKLIQVINILPNEPPRDLTEEGYTQINALWQIIYKRGEQFNGKNETVSTDRCAGFIKE